MKITFNIPDDLAERLGTPSKLERELLEKLALQAFNRGDMTRNDLCRLLGRSVAETEAFLREHGIPGSPDELDELARAKAGRAIENIIARRRGITLGDLSTKELIDEGRP